jgi:hypothetical protein
MRKKRSVDAVDNAGEVGRARRGNEPGIHIRERNGQKKE